MSLHIHQARAGAETPSSEARPITSAIFLNDTTPYVNLLKPYLINPSLGFTVEMWFKPTTAGVQSGRLISKMSSTLNIFSVLFTSRRDVPSGNYVVDYEFGASGKDCQYKTVTHQVTVAADRSSEITSWHHIAGVIQQDGTLNIFIDGKKASETNSISGICASDTPVQLGARKLSENTIDGYFKGEIAELRISKIARYSADFALQVRDFSEYDDQLLGLWHFKNNLHESRSNVIEGEFVGKVSFVDALLNRNKISWITPYVSLEADHFYIDTYQVKYLEYLASVPVFSLYSDPGNNTRTTLEATWQEHGHEMKMNMDFTYTPGQFWKLSEVRTYNGQNPGEWIYYTPNDQFGQPLQNVLGVPYIHDGTLELRSKAGGQNGLIHFEGLKLRAFQYPVPQINSISHRSANQGTRITLNGSGFTSDIEVYVDDALMPKQSYQFSNNSNSMSFILSTETSFTINNTYDVHTSNKKGASNSVKLKVTSPVKLDRASPDVANFGQLVTLSGSGFGTSVGSVFFINEKGDYSAGAPVVTWNDKKITFTTPAVKGYSVYNIQVSMGKQPVGKISYVSNTIKLIVRAGQPYIASITPKNVKVGKEITINGTEFGSKRGNILFITGPNKSAVGAIVSWTNTKVKVTIPTTLKKDTDYQIQVVTSDKRKSSTVFYHIGK